jgi:hypothetical protein
MENPRHLLVVGATPAVRHLLDTAVETPGGVTYVDDPADGLDTLHEHPDALVAYGPTVFGRASTAQPTRLAEAQRSVALLTTAAPSELPEDDPERLVWQAAVALNVDYVVALLTESARHALAGMLAGTVGR